MIDMADTTSHKQWEILLYTGKSGDGVWGVGFKAG